MINTVSSFIESKYLWEGKDNENNIKFGFFEGVNTRQHKFSLNQKGVFDCRYHKLSARVLNNKLTPELVTHFVSSLRMFIGGGMNIEKSFVFLLNQTNSLEIKYICASIVISVNSGKTLSKACEELNNKIPTIFLSVIKVSDEAGNLEEALEKIEEYYIINDKSLKAIYSSLRYPVLVAFFLVSLYLFVLLVVIPNQKHIYEFRSVELPLPTQILFTMSDALRFAWPLILSTGLCFIVAMVLLPKTRKKIHKNISDRFFDMFRKWHEPLLFATSMNLLLSTGYQIETAIELLSKDGDKKRRDIFFSIRRQLHEGKLLSETLDATKVFPPYYKEIIALSEYTGDEQSGFAKLEMIQYRLWNDVLKKFSTYIQPAMLVMISVFIAFLLYAVYKPLFSFEI